MPERDPMGDLRRAVHEAIEDPGADVFELGTMFLPRGDIGLMGGLHLFGRVGYKDLGHAGGGIAQRRGGGSAAEDLVDQPHDAVLSLCSTGVR